MNIKKEKITNKNEFLEKLATLIEEHNAALSYTTDDDGIHIYINGGCIFGDEIFSGYIDNGKKGAENLRKAKDT